LWEGLAHSGQKVGAPSLPGGYSKSGEAGTTRKVRTVCKAVQDLGCEKSGKPVEFREFLHAQGQVNDVPLASFKGNRFIFYFITRLEFIICFMIFCHLLKNIKQIMSSLPLLILI
jgi:hypothetical protein